MNDMVECSWSVNVPEMAERRASFSGLGGIGGAISGGELAGKGGSKGDERRSTGGCGGLGGACCGGRDDRCC